MRLQPNPYQKAIYEFVENGDGNALVEAVAGSGKTHTIVQALEFTCGRSIFLAFNKTIALEIGKKIPPHTKAQTLHAMGLSICRSNVHDVIVDKDAKKGMKIDSAIYSRWPDEQHNRYQRRKISERYAPSLYAAASKAISLAKSMMLSRADQIAEMCIQHDVVCPGDLDDFADGVVDCLDWCFRYDSVVDFDDMVWLPALHFTDGSWKPTTKYDWLMVDEAQDLSACQRVMIEHLLADDGRCIAVGDSKQAIYGFRGADCDSMSKFQETFHARELPLSICYRCPTSHIALAQKIVPQIEAAPGAIAGMVSKCSSLDEHNVRDGDMILCRRNAPLTEQAIRFIGAGRKAVILGRKEIGKSLISFVYSFRQYDIKQLLSDMSIYEIEEVQKLIESHRHNAAENLSDRCSCVRVLSRGARSSEDVVAKINSIFAEDSGTGIILSSVHRAKGLEADNVYILEYNRMPASWPGQQSWQKQQEQNLIYVALTRAKKRLVLVIDQEYERKKREREESRDRY